MERKFGVSAVSLLPWSMGREGFYRSVEIIGRAGFDGLQILPIRSWRAELALTDYVISFEDAWNSGSFFGAIEREIYQFITRSKCAMEHKPLLIDWLLFGSKKRCEKTVKGFIRNFPQAIYISNGWTLEEDEKYGATEICPELIKDVVDGVSSYCRMLDTGACLDNEHLLRAGRHGESPLTTMGGLEKFLDSRIPSRKIKIIHVKPHSQAGLELPKMLQVLNERTRETKPPVILEDKPIFKSKKKTIDWLKKQLEFLRKHFD